MSEHIFISYNRTDGSSDARKLHDHLLKHNYRPWLDIHDIKPGAIWQEETDLAIRNCWLLAFVATPGSVQSRICTAEWNRALTYKKPVVPLLFEHVLLPLILDQRQYIPFVESQEKGFEELLKHLAFLKSPDGELWVMQSRYSDLELELVHHLHPEVNSEAIKAEMNELKEQIAFKKYVLENSDVQMAKYKRDVEQGIVIERTRLAKEREDDQAMLRRRIIGTPPLESDRIFKNREPELIEIVNALTTSNDIRIISIYGKAGSGKTALACRVMNKLEKQNINVFGLTYHSTQNGNVTFDQIYSACGRILGGDAEKKLMEVWQSSASKIEAKIETLLAFLQNHCIVILLDNLESIQGANGEILDVDLKLFIETFLKVAHKSRILLTSREILKLPTKEQQFEKAIPLDEGLATNHAIDLLVELGKNRNLQRQQPSKSVLETAAKRTFGYPRALETIIGILDEDPRLTLAELLQQSDIFDERVLENLTAEAQSRLSPEAKTVMQALAVFERPIVSTALMYILEPYAASIDISSVLERLVRGYFVKVNHATGEYVIHPLDREYSYRLIPSDNTNPYNIKALEKRAASYYSLLQTASDAWMTIADLEPQLHAFSHLCKAQDFNDAARLIDPIASKYLIRWGHLTLVINMRLQLVDKIQDEHLQCVNLAALSEAYRSLGKSETAIGFGKKALEIAVKINDKSLENIALGYLGRTYRNLGRVHEAVEYLERAIKIAQDIGDKVSEGRHIGNLGSAYYNLGDFNRSIKFLEQSIELNRIIGESGEVAERTGHLGNPYFHLGNYDKAIELYNKALSLSRELHQKRGEGYWLWLLGRAYSYSGSAIKGVEFLNKANSVAIEIEDERLRSFILVSLTETYLNLGQVSQAFSIAEMAVKFDVPELNAEATALYGITLALLGKSDEASQSLDKAIESADDLLSKTDGFFEAKYTRSISLTALALLKSGVVRAILLKEAKNAYSNAISYCNADGVRKRNLALLSKLKALDQGDSLRDILQLFSNYTDRTNQVEIGVRENAKVEKSGNANKCPHCRANTKQVKSGKNKSGSQRMRCKVCGKNYTLQLQNIQKPSVDKPRK